MRFAGIKIHYLGALREWRLIWSFALPTFLLGAMVAPVAWIGNAILYRNSGVEQMAIFNVALNWRDLLLFLPTMLVRPILPVFSQLYAEGSLDRLKIAALKAIMFIGGLTALAAVVLSVASPWIVRAYGSGFASGAIVLVAMLGVAVLFSVGSVIGQVIISFGAVWRGLLFNGIWAVNLLCAAVILVPKFHALGLAMSYMWAYTC